MEKWKDVKNYEDYHQISNLGRIRSKKRIIYNENGTINRKMNEKFLKTRSDVHTKFYHTVTLNIKNKKKTFYLHRLVGEAFVDNPNNLPQINHKDGNKSNNRYDNLEWATQEDNMAHAVDTGLLKARKNFKNVYQESDSKGRFLSKQISQYDKDMNFIRTFNGPKEASEITGFSRQSIADCARGRYKTCGGYIWKYV